MPFPAQLTRRASSIAIQISRDLGSRHEEEGVSQTAEREANDDGKTQQSKTDVEDNESDGGGDTDIMESSDEESDNLDARINAALQSEKSAKADGSPPVRMSKRLMSMKRRGRIVPVVVEDETFQYYAGDVVAVRGEEDDFYLCTVLEDVAKDATEFQVSWFNRTSPGVYEASFDDVCYVASVVERVKLTQRGDGLFSLSDKLAKRIKRLIHQALKAENPEYVISNAGLSAVVEEDESVVEEDGEDEPPAKKTRQSKTQKTSPAPKRKKLSKEEKTPAGKPAKIPKRRGLLPNPAIELIDEDPTFKLGSSLSLPPVKWAIGAVLGRDNTKLQEIVDDKENVYTVHWNRSVDIHMGPVHYALLDDNLDAIEILHKFSHKERTAKIPSYQLAQIDTGKYNFFTFGHAVRNITGSRGAREGNDAFLKETEGIDAEVEPSFLMKRGVSIETAESYYALKKIEFETIITDVWRAVRNGHRKLAGHLIKLAVEKDGYGFNFLHRDVLLFDNEPLPKFRSPSVTKKPYENKLLLPIHCACINPNPAYLQALMAVLPEYGKPDATQRKPIHFAAACEGPGPMKLLLSRGLDPNDIDSKGRTPLMIAAKLGRDVIIEELTSLTVEEFGEEEEVTEVQRVNLNAKSKATLSAMHYAAKFGRTSTIMLLVSKGAVVDLQCGSFRDNMTPLVMAARRGHLDTIKALVELGANPDKKVRQNKTALIFAILNGHAHVVAYLLNVGVDPNIKDTSANSAIHYACGYGWYYCAKLLLEGGADPNVANMWKTTPLALALLKDNEVCAELLLSVDGVDVNFRDDRGCTILAQLMMNAYDEKMVRRVKFLVQEKSADPRIADSKGLTALHYLASHSVFENRSPKSTPEQSTKRHSSEWTKPTFVLAYSEICCAVAEVLIGAGANVNALDEDGNSPLMFAVLQHNAPLLKLLVQHGALGSVGCEKESKRTVLHCLLSDNSLLNLEELYCFTIPVNGSYEDACAVLKTQVLKMQKEVLETLIACGADLNAIDKSGTTALMQAFQKGTEFLPLADLLLMEGASPLVGENDFSHSLVHCLALACTGFDAGSYLASMKKKFDLSELVNKRDNDGFTPFLLACEAMADQVHTEVTGSRAKAFLKALVKECDADVNVTVGKPTQGLKHHQHRNIRSFNLKLDNPGEDPLHSKENDPYKDFGATGRFSFFHFMALNSSPLLDASFIINMVSKDYLHFVDRYCRQPLHLAIRNQNYRVAEKLVYLGASCDEKSGNVDEDSLGTPLCMASRRKDSSAMVKMLLDAGADTNICDGLNGQSPLIHSTKWRTYDNAEPLEIIKLLLDHGARIDCGDRCGRTPLHYAVNAGSGGYEDLTEIEDMLIDHGADVNAQDKEMRTPMFYAFIKINALPPRHHNEKTNNDEDDQNSNNHQSDQESQSDEDDGDDSDDHLKGEDTDDDEPHESYENGNEDDDNQDTVDTVDDDDYQDANDNPDNSNCLRKDHNLQPASCSVKTGDPISIVTTLCEGMHQQSKDFTASLNARDVNGQSVLHACCTVGAELCCMYLLKAGSVYAVQDKDGNVPLALSLKHGSNSCTRLLLQEGCSADYKVVTPVTESDEEQYKKKVEDSRWRYKGSVSIAKPERVINGAFELAIGKDWHGVAYTMLEVSKLPFMEAFKASLKTNKLALLWTLIKKQRKKEVFFSKDEQGANLLHILASHRTFDSCYRDGVEFAKVLCNIGVPVDEKDSLGAVPLHYSARNHNVVLSRFLMDKYPASVNCEDSNGMTPAAALTESDLSFSSDAITILKELFGKGFTKAGSTYHVKASVTTDADSGKLEVTSLLSEAVLLSNPGDFRDDMHSGLPIGLIEYLLKHGADVDVQADKQQTPLMVAAACRYTDAVKLLLSYKAKVNLQDIDGKTVLHYFTCCLDYGTCADLEIADLLCKGGADPALADNQGQSPLYHAESRSAMSLVEMMQLFLKKRKKATSEPMLVDDKGYTFASAMDEHWEGDPPAVKSDVEEELKEVRQNMPRRVNIPQVDKAFHMAGACEVYIDPKTGVPYDLHMTKVDVKWGYYGLNTFYKMQIVFHKGKNLWVLFNAWGRISDSGQNQQTPFDTPDEAVQRFKKIFKSKAGNEWEDKDRFVKKPKKYSLLVTEKNPERMHRYCSNVLKPFDLSLCPKSKLPKELAHLMEAVTDVQTLNTIIQRERLLEPDLTPFGMVSHDTLEKAKEILEQIRDIVSKLDGTEIRGNQGAAARFEEVAELSNQFYMMVPPRNYAFDRVSPLNQMSKIKEADKTIWHLMELSYTCQILLGAQHRKKVVSPLDYCYKALNCHIEAMDPDSAECQMILQCIEANEGLTAKGVFRVQRPGEETNFAACGVMTNRRLLWHGTMRAHVVGIASLGFRLDPCNAEVMGNRFGNGIYFSHRMSVAKGFCRSYDSEPSLIFLCEVALGKMCHVACGEWKDPRQTGDDSTWVEAREVPDPRNDVITPYGALLHAGKTIQNQDKKFEDTHLSYRHECVVYDEHQVRIRYLIEL